MANYYYEAVQVNVNVTDRYFFFSDSDINMCGFMYKNYFDPNNPTENKQLDIVENCKTGQFKLRTELYSNTTYILAVTTFDANAKGSFNIIASGPNNVIFKRLSE
jgi:hypothetical protein